MLSGLLGIDEATIADLEQRAILPAKTADVLPRTITVSLGRPARGARFNQLVPALGEEAPDGYIRLMDPFVSLAPAPMATSTLVLDWCVDHAGA